MLMASSINLRGIVSKQLADARFYQIVYLSVFLIYGVQSLHWDFDLKIVSAIIITGISYPDNKLHDYEKILRCT